MKVAARSVRKASVPSSLFQNPSPGNLQSTRLALHIDEYDSSCWVYIASGRHVYQLQIPMGDDSSVVEGKEGLLIPVQTQVMESSLLNRCPHRSEIQSIVLSETESPGYLVLGSVDGYGHFIVSKLDFSDEECWLAVASKIFASALTALVPNWSNTTIMDGLTYSVLPRDSGIGEGSWVGLCFSPSQWSMAAVARGFCKSIDVYDQDIHLRTMRTLSYPTSLNFLESLSNGAENSILAVTEGCQLTLWDLRVKENGGCIRRVCGSVGDVLYSVCGSSNGNVAVGGADRTVTIYDPRRWSSLGRWVNCSKYEITGLAFSSLDPDYIYIQGVDYEVFCGDWKQREKAFSFRGDSNWLGFSKCSNKDILGGWCDSGSIFVADVVSKDKEITIEEITDEEMVEAEIIQW